MLSRLYRRSSSLLLSSSSSSLSFLQFELKHFGQSCAANCVVSYKSRYSSKSDSSIEFLIPSPPSPPTRQNMPDSMNLTFLGTSAGKPSLTRNVSSLALKVDRSIWVVDAGEATQHQFQKSKLKMSQISHIFITHMHGDHVNGLPGLLCTISAGEGSVLPGQTDPRLAASSSPAETPTIIYGPSGLRQFLRVTLGLTQSILSRPYIVHELLFEGEKVFTCSENELHPSERPGRNIEIDASIGGWHDFDHLANGGVKISAGPILHTIPCVGYIFTELPRPLPLDPKLYIPHLKRNAAALLSTQGIKNPLSLLSVLTSKRESITLPDGTVLTPPPLGVEGRKIVILGDTYDAFDGFVEQNSKGADLVVHEATNAFLPDWDESQVKEGVTRESVREKAKEHGHSTPEVAGEFARRVEAKSLVLNHLSNKYADNGILAEGEEEVEEGNRIARGMLKQIEELATHSWGAEGRRAIVARDFLEVEIKRRDKQ